MKQSLFTPRTIITVLLLLTVLTACKKGPDIWGPDCGPCPPVPRCQPQQKLMYLYYDGAYHAQDFPKIKKAFAANGTVNYLEISLPPFAPIGGEEHSLDVKYTGNRVYLFNSTTHDTVLVAKLDACGRPTWSDHLAKDGNRNETKYFYNAQGRLSRTTYEPFFGFANHRYVYDKYGNLIKYYEEATPARNMEFTYDYSRPIKGASYDFDSNLPMQAMILLAALGHIDFPAHHLLKSIKDNDDYPYDHREYSNQVINGDGYVTSYDYTFYYPDNHARNITTWSCGKPGGGLPKF